ncbi:MAG: tRNA (adenosine(37)-N6)-dimethylallyltransferase MiaA, partial [Selenomonas sp.]
SAVPHHFIDILAPEASFNVMDFQRLARKEIGRIAARGKLPLVVGGTGLYIKSLLEGYVFNETSGDRAYREKLERLAQEKGKAFVHGLLQEADPDAAARLHVNDFRRVVRALEVASLGNEHISEQREAAGGELAYDAYVIGLRRERQALYARIEERVDAMLEAGFADEVCSLLAEGVPRDCPAMKGIGYREMLAYFAGSMDLPLAAEEIKKATRHFAKRQLTWFRKMPYVHWYAASQGEELLLEKICTDIRRSFHAGKTAEPTG